jgi:hypothetical protein
MPMPAYVRNARFNILAANALGRALMRRSTRSLSSPTPRFVILNRAEVDFVLDFDKIQNDSVAFRTKRAAHNVRCLSATDSASVTIAQPGRTITAGQPRGRAAVPSHGGRTSARIRHSQPQTARQSRCRPSRTGHRPEGMRKEAALVA